MKYLKKLSNSAIYVGSIMIIVSFIVTILNYFNIISDKTNNLFLTLISAIAMIIGGYKMGTNTKSKGWIEGLKFSLIVTILFILMSLIIFKYQYKINNFIYYIILSISAILGSIIGKNRSHKTN